MAGSPAVGSIQGRATGGIGASGVIMGDLKDGWVIDKPGEEDRAGFVIHNEIGEGMVESLIQYGKITAPG